MPLDSNDPRLVWMLCRLHSPGTGKCHGVQLLGYLVDRLVVPVAHRECLATKYCCETTARHNINRFVNKSNFPGFFINNFPVPVNVLVDSTAQRCVEQL